LLARRRRPARDHRAPRARWPLDRHPGQLHMSGVALASGYAADVAFGDPRRFHPVAGFGKAALAAERASYAPSRGRGAAYAAAVVGPLLWGAVAGPAGVAAYRAANTLDAMVGHRSDRYRDFGWASARLDDALNWPVARASAALTVACAPLAGGSPSAALRTW